MEETAERVGGGWVEIGGWWVGLVFVGGRGWGSVLKKPGEAYDWGIDQGFQYWCSVTCGLGSSVCAGQAVHGGGGCRGSHTQGQVFCCAGVLLVNWLTIACTSSLPALRSSGRPRQQSWRRCRELRAKRQSALRCAGSLQRPRASWPLQVGKQLHAAACLAGASGLSAA